MLKKILIGLAALALCYVVAGVTATLLNSFIRIKARANAIAALTGVPAGAVVTFLSQLNDLNIDLAAYTDSDLAAALTNGFKLKFEVAGEKFTCAKN